MFFVKLVFLIGGVSSWYEEIYDYNGYETADIQGKKQFSLLLLHSNAGGRKFPRESNDTHRARREWKRPSQHTNAARLKSSIH